LTSPTPESLADEVAPLRAQAHAATTIRRNGRQIRRAAIGFILKKIVPCGLKCHGVIVLV